MRRRSGWWKPLSAAAFVGLVVGGVLWAKASGFEPPGAAGAAQDRSVREAMDQLRDDMAAAEDADFDELPEDLTELRRPGPWLFAGYERCGSVDLASFDGDWAHLEGGADFADPTVEDGRVQMGHPLRAELCPVHVLERGAARLEAVAVHHEDVHDPGDAALVYLRLTREGDRLRVSWAYRRDQLDRFVVELRARR